MKVSVVIPCYNCAGSIQETLESILSQSYRDVEVIAVDDGSRDATAGVLAGYEDRIKIVSQPNSGVSTARNTGVQHATGDWVAFCDSDDLWRADKLDVLAAAIAAVPAECEVVFSDYSIMDAGVITELRGTMSRETMFPMFREFGIRIEDMFPQRQKLERGQGLSSEQGIDLYFGDIYGSLILGNVILPSAVLVRRDAFNAVSGFRPEFRNAEDTECFLRLAKQCRFLYVDEPLITYRRGSESLLSTSMLKTIINGIRAVEINCRDDSATYEMFGEVVDKSLARKYAKLGYFYLTELDTKNAFASARTALRFRKGESMAWRVMLASRLPRVLLAGVRSLKVSWKAARTTARRVESDGESRSATRTG